MNHSMRVIVGAYWKEIAAELQLPTVMTRLQPIWELLPTRPSLCVRYAKIQLSVP